MKFVSSLFLAFVTACLGWSFIATGPVLVGTAILGVCFAFAYVMSAHLAFGTLRNYVTYLEEIQLWANTMIP